MDTSSEKPERLMIGFPGSDSVDYEIDLKTLGGRHSLYLGWNVDAILHSLISGSDHAPSHVPVKPGPGMTRTLYMPVANAYFYLA